MFLEGIVIGLCGLVYELNCRLIDNCNVKAWLETWLQAEL